MRAADMRVARATAPLTKQATPRPACMSVVKVERSVMVFVRDTLAGCEGSRDHVCESLVISRHHEGNVGWSEAVQSIRIDVWGLRETMLDMVVTCRSVGGMQNVSGRSEASGGRGSQWGGGRPRRRSASGAWVLSQRERGATHRRAHGRYSRMLREAAQPSPEALRNGRTVLDAWERWSN